jgi:DNA-binding transcriptional MerR regulator
VKPPSDHIKIGDFARLADTNLRTLRYYEELGLLCPAARSDGGFRYYRPTDLNRVRMIQNLQELGLHLDDIGVLINCRNDLPDRTAWLAKVDEALVRQEELVAQRVGALQAQRRELASARAKLAGACKPCTHQPEKRNNFCEPCRQSGESLPPFLSALF